METKDFVDELNQRGFPVDAEEIVEDIGDLTLDDYCQVKIEELFDGVDQISTKEDLAGLMINHKCPTLPLRRVQSYVDIFVQYPIDEERFLELFGDVAVESPSSQETEKLRNIILRCSDGTNTYVNTNEMINVIFCNVGEEQVGRKNYDDRGTPVGDSGDNPSF